MIRLNKYIADAGVCTRREADKLILAGLINVNGTPITILGKKIKYSDVVEYKGKKLSLLKHQYLLFNKPKEDDSESVELVNKKHFQGLIETSSEELFVLGDLESASSGVMLITNDANVYQRVKNAIDKIKQKIVIELDKEVDSKHLESLQKGINFNDRFYVFKSITWGDKGENKRVLIIESQFDSQLVLKEFFFGKICIDSICFT